MAQRIEIQAPLHLQETNLQLVEDQFTQQPPLNSNIENNISLDALSSDTDKTTMEEGVAYTLGFKLGVKLGDVWRNNLARKPDESRFDHANRVVPQQKYIDMALFGLGGRFVPDWIQAVHAVSGLISSNSTNLEKGVNAVELGVNAVQKIIE